MFNKTLLALAITGFASVATAATIDPKGSGVGTSDTIQTVSAEGAVGSTTAALGAVEFKIANAKKASYTNLKRIVVDIEGASLSPATAAEVTLTNTETDGISAVVTYPSVKQVVFTITGDNADAAADGLTLADNSVFAIDGLDLVFDSLTLGSQVKYTITAESAVAGAAIESQSAVVTQVVNQFAAKATTPFGKGIQIDVEEGRKEFTDGAASKTNTSTDTATVAIVDTGTDLLSATVDNTTADFTLSGDFTFLDADGDGSIDAGYVLTGVNAADLQSTTLSNTSSLSEDFTITTDGEVVLPAQSYTASVNVDYTTFASKVANYSATISAGEWTLNGSSDKIAFLPFGSAYAQSITVTNTGKVEGEITVELTANGETKAKTLTAIAAKDSVTNISSEVAAFAAELGINGDAGVNVIVNAPDDNISVKGVYYHKASQDRVLTY